MKTIAEFDLKNYNSEWNTFFREAVRVIIVKEGKIAMVKSGRVGYYKFPGGGKRRGETYVQTAMRETLEETGLSLVKDSVKEFGAVREKRKSNRRPDEIFEQISYYYTADASDGVSVQKLDGYEADEGYSLEWVDIEEACETNKFFGNQKRYAFLAREIFVLEEILKDLATV